MAKELIGVTLRWLDGDALDALEPILAEKGWMALNKPLSRALVAYDINGSIIGFECFQCLPHVMPLFVNPEWRASGLAEEITDQMVSFLREAQAVGVMVVADSPHTAKIAEKYGMTKLDAPAYMKINQGTGEF